MTWPSTIELSVVEGPDAPLSVRSTGQLTIGRAGHCDVSLQDDSASREHAVVVRVGDDFILVDLESAGGTFIGEERTKIVRHRLHDGDEVRIGQNLLKITIRPGGAATDSHPKPESRPDGEVAAEDAPAMTLTVVNGPDQGKTFALPELGRIQIGRLPTCDVRLHDRLVSRLHATIRQEDSGYVIYDENSSNGLEVGTSLEKVPFAKLEDGLNFRIGVTELQVSLASGEAGAQAGPAKGSRRSASPSRHRPSQARPTRGGEPPSRRRSDLGL